MNIATGPNGQTTKSVRYDSRLIAIDQITVPPNRRPINTDTVRTLAASVQKIGLQNPISVIGSADKGYTLIAGAHRLEAVRSIDGYMILASIMKVSEVDARLWEISENLHRADLSTLERSEQVAEWIALTEGKPVSSQVETKRSVRGVEGEGRPESGVNAAAREIGVDKNEAHRSIKIAAIAPEAKDAARAAGIDDNQSALLKVAAAPKEQQAEVVAGIAAAKAGRKPSARTAVATTLEYDTVEINGEPVRCTTSSKSELAAIRSLFRRELTSFTSNEFEESDWNAPVRELFREHMEAETKSSVGLEGFIIDTIQRSFDRSFLVFSGGGHPVDAIDLDALSIEQLSELSNRICTALNDKRDADRRAA